MASSGIRCCKEDALDAFRSTRAASTMPNQDPGAFMVERAERVVRRDVPDAAWAYGAELSRPSDAAPYGAVADDWRG